MSKPRARHRPRPRGSDAVRPVRPRDARSPRAPRRSAFPPPLAGWWRRRSTSARVALLAGVALAVLVGVNVWLHARPPTPDANAVHADVVAGRSGAEVTFVGKVTADPTTAGGHERIQVRDQPGDSLELDYNLSLGRPVPVHRGDSIVVHGQLYVDPGRAGVHCLHAVTSSGCPEAGWIQFQGSTYS